MKSVSRPLFVASILSATIAAAIVGQVAQRPDVGWNEGKTRFKLYNGWSLSPAGNRITLNGDMPGKIVFSPDGNHALVATSGYNDHSLTVFDWRTGEITDSKVVARSSFGISAEGDAIYTSGGRSGGKTEDIRKWQLAGGKLMPIGAVTLTDIAPDLRFVTSLLNYKGDLYVVNAQSNEILRLDSLGKVVAKTQVGYRPRAVAMSPNKRFVAVSDWGGSGVVLLEAQTLRPIKRIKTLPHPTALAYHPDGRYFVAESGANTILQNRGGVLTRITVSVDKLHRVGPTPTDLCVSPDGKRLFVTLAGENAVAVLDVTGERPKVLGHIPTERWPSSVAVTPDGKRLLVATAKGFYGPSQAGGKEIPNAGSAKRQMTARVAFIDMPNQMQLNAMSVQVAENMPEGDRSTGLTSGQKSMALANLKKIKHVIYVIKENKSYDQVFGDISGANGDPSVTIFGERITPNQHALARDFVIFDNLYCDGESSQVGHQWTTSAYANEYTESQWSSNYGDKGELTSDKRLTASPGEYLWSIAREKKLSARVYGEYVDVQEGHGSLEDQSIRENPEKWGYSEAWERVFARGGRDTEKLATFLEELKGFERTGKMPSLMVMALPDDHTHGYSAGSYSPKAMVGDNDLAVGQLVEAISKSRFWNDTAIFVIQDDTQGSLDHVDSHRTYGLVVSPWTMRGVVDSTHYTTASMLRTMELILGLPPMSSYDAMATPMLRPFIGNIRVNAWKSLPPCQEINDKNPGGVLSLRSGKLDWTDIDRADPEEWGRLLWDGERPGQPFPAK
ncbi:MAG: beta-propeller fold lactonase family protein [Armatimonadetes bacterium]|nr:beta-propeller fold lactonase family protein [Armatimonadota bacterium]